MRFGAYSHVKFGAVLSGQFRLSVDDQPEPIILQEGDCYLLTDGRPYRTYNPPDTAEFDGTAYFVANRSADGVVRLGDGPPDKVAIGGPFTFNEEGAAWLREALPPFIHIKADAPEAKPLRTTLALLGQEAGCGAPGEGVIIGRLADILLVQAIRAHLASAGPPASN